MNFGKIFLVWRKRYSTLSRRRVWLFFITVTRHQQGTPSSVVSAAASAAPVLDVCGQPLPDTTPSTR